MKKPTFKRVLAYLIDMIIVSIIASAFSSIKFLNPDIDKYNEAYDAYVEFLNEGINNNNIQNLINGEEYQNITYNLTYYGRYSNIITLVITFLYFVVFQYFTKGYTGGKKILNIKVEADDKKLKFYKLLIRSLIINSLFTSLLTVITLVFLNKESFVQASTFISLLEMGLLFVSFGMILYREDGKGLHDLIAGTKVINCK